MKKITVVLMTLFMAQGIAFSAQRGTPEYDQLKEYKNKQRAEREAAKTAPKPTNPGRSSARRSGDALR